MSSNEKEIRFIALQDGRRLAYSIYGSADLSNPVLYLHGFPGSRLEASFADRLAEELGISIVAPDRPGFGLSDPPSGEPFESWPAVFEALLDGLGIERAGLLAVSGGSPFALVSALAHPERLTRTLIVSGVGPNTESALEGMTPGNRALFSLARRSRRAATAAARMIGAIWRKHPAMALTWLRLNTRGSDKVVLRPGTFGGLVARSIEESLRRGSAPGAREFGWLASDWSSIPIEKIRCRVDLWHGLSDVYVPASMTRAIATRIPGASCRYFEGHGHFMAFELVREILEFFRTETAVSPAAY